MTWQDMHNAPRDGSEILLAGYLPDASDPSRMVPRVTAGFWVEPSYIEDSFESGFAHMHGGSTNWMSTDGGFTEEYPPLAWQHLPEWS